MSWTDEEIDKLFGDAANKQVFEYKSEYWKDIEKQLPIQKQVKTPYWWWTANVFILGFLGLIVFDVTKQPITVAKSDVEKSIMHATNSSRNLANTEKRNLLSSIQKKKQTIDKDKQIILESKKLSKDELTKKDILISSTANIFINRDPNINRIDNQKSQNYSSIKGAENEVAQLKIVEPVVIALTNEVRENTENIDSIEEKEVIELKNIENDKNGLITKSITPFEFSSELDNSILHASETQLRKIYLEIYGGVGQSYARNETNQHSVNATMGGIIGLSFPLNRFVITSGIGFQATKFDQLNILERTKVYGFGSQMLENSYEFSSIYALTIPISASYTFGRHSLNLGLTANVNLMTQLKHSQSLDGAFKSYSTGFSDVSFFNRFGLLPSVGYSYNVNEKTQIGARINIQILQQLQSNRFIGSPLRMPLDGQFYLRRTIAF